MNPSERANAMASPLLDTLWERFSNRKTVKWVSFLLTLFILLLVSAAPASGAEKFCSDAPYFGVIDGSIRPAPNQISIDMDCTFKNFPASKPLTTTINFHTNDPTIYLIIFDNVIFTGHMACANVDHRIWFSNSSDYGSSNACQDLFIPVETIDKQNPLGQTTAAIGVPFTYTLTLPSMNLGGGPSANDLHSVTIWDDLTATGADLTYVDINAYYKGTGNPVTLVPEDDPSAPGGVWTPKNLSYKKIPLIRAGEQIVVEITVVLDDMAANSAGTQFMNTAKWQFGRLIDDTYYEPLPGEWGRTEPMTIVEPGLVLTKTGSTSVINLGQWAEYAIDISNSGLWAGDAWDVNVMDQFPANSSSPFNGGLCDMIPEVTDVTLAGRSLTQNTDYSISYAGCQLSFTLLDAAGPVGPDEHLIIQYRTKVDADSESGAVLTNIAGVNWSNDMDDAIAHTYTCTLTNGTEGTQDCQDAHDLLVTLSGYFFEKIAANPLTGDVVSTAMPGETLRYTLSLWSIDEVFANVRFFDDLNASSAFVPGSISLVSYPVGADISNTGNGILDVRNLSVPVGEVIEVTFDITLAPDLTEGFVVLNQADLMNGAGKIADSDDPNVNGQADPALAGDEDPTQVVIYVAQALQPEKTIVSPVTAEATIGQEVVYEIRIPETVIARPLYDVVLTDTLDENLEYLGFTQISGPAVTDNSIPPDLNFSVSEIPAGQQAVIELRTRIRNVLSAQQGVAVNNTVSYTYANTLGGSSQTPLTSGTVTIHIVEPHITDMSKSANPPAPAAGDVMRYSITLVAGSGLYASDVLDISITDTMGAGLVYEGNPAVTVGSGVSSDNTISEPVVYGDGSIGAPQTLVWSPAAGNADIDIAEGTSVTISYDVRVLNSVPPNQVLTNSVVAQWTGIDGLFSYERDGSDGIGGLNDYETTAASTTNMPELYAHKTVQKVISNPAQSSIVSSGDTLRYTIVISNSGAVPATDVVITDTIPNDTIYVADSLRINGMLQGPDGGVFPLTGGLLVHSSDNPGAGIISGGESATITFEVTVDNGVLVGTIISNQGTLISNELPSDLTDADNIPSNGRQPTVIVVGDVQIVSTTKEVLVIGGGHAIAGGQLEYVIRVTNIGSIPVTDMVITDDLRPPLGDQITYINGGGTLSGSPAGVTFNGGVLTADYAGQYGDLQPGATAVMRFRVLINPALDVGTTITNTGVVQWDDPTQSTSASVSLDLGGTPGEAALNGTVWHDANLDKIVDTGFETFMQGWTVELYRNSLLTATALTDAGGNYHISGLSPNDNTSDVYELRFRAAGAGPNTASMGHGDSLFTNGPQLISDIIFSAGSNVQNLNVPLWPNGAVFNSVTRSTVAGATVTLLNATTGTVLPGQCLDDPVQQNQVTAQNGFYKFDLNFSHVSCPAEGGYLIEVTPPASGYMNTPSQIIALPQDNTAATLFPVPDCPGNPQYDAMLTTNDFCEVMASSAVPPPSVSPDDIRYYRYLKLGNGTIPGQSQIFNNFIPIDPELDGAVAITKTSSMSDVTRGTLVPYTITVTNIYGVPLYNVRIVDLFPAGFKYVEGSARVNGSPAEPSINGQEMVWDGLELQVNQNYTIQFLLIVGSGVSEGEYTNRAMVINAATGSTVSGEATATVRVIPDPDLDCTDVIGKVFDDRNMNGYQDSDENGLPGARLATARGLIASTDKNGRFHITCAIVPNEDRGSNFILKLDERSLPSGYRLTTENPRVQRATRGKMLRFTFGVTIHRVVRIDIADGVFKPDTTELRTQWIPRIAQLLDELKVAPSVLRLSYLGDVESKGLVKERLETLKEEITKQWKQLDVGYRLTIETEIFWRRGAPLEG